MVATRFGGCSASRVARYPFPVARFPIPARPSPLAPRPFVFFSGAWCLVPGAYLLGAYMRVLHTSDWHVGKRLERHDRMDEHAAVIDEVVGIAASENPDLVLHSGDLFDRPVPTVEALSVGLGGLVRLADSGRRPVVVVAGNHDSPELFETLKPFLSPFGVHLVGKIMSADEGGVITLSTGAGTAHVACLPFLRASQVVDFMSMTDDWYRTYAGRLQRIAETYADDLGRLAKTGDATFLVGHYMISGVKVDTAGPRGERDIHIGQAYAATESSVPTKLDYVALGHIHAPQRAPGANVPAEYAGSLLQLDFGEAGESKRVVVVDTKREGPAAVRSVPITAGRPLLRAEGRWEEITARTDLEGAFLDLTVHTDGPEPDLMDRARERFPGVVKVRAEYPRKESTRRVSSGRPWGDLYAEYHTETHGAAPSAGLATLFEEIREEVTDAPS